MANVVPACGGNKSEHFASRRALVVVVPQHPCTLTFHCRRPLPWRCLHARQVRSCLSRRHYRRGTPRPDDRREMSPRLQASASDDQHHEILTGARRIRMVRRSAERGVAASRWERSTGTPPWPGSAAARGRSKHRLLARLWNQSRRGQTSEDLRHHRNPLDHRRQQARSDQGGSHAQA